MELARRPLPVARKSSDSNAQQAPILRSVSKWTRDSISVGYVTGSRDQRQILAIMFTDVVGYTALTERDEGAALRVRAQHRDLVRTLVEQFEGELIDATGDESFSIFPSALRAVDCALALQGALRSYPGMRLRIGLHLGDVIRRDGEVVGVNVAARIRPGRRDA